ncbi:MAG: hypothetical protein ACRD0A_20105 [Acidimicrobiales bacterium]
MSDGSPPARRSRHPARLIALFGVLALLAAVVGLARVMFRRAEAPLSVSAAASTPPSAAPSPPSIGPTVLPVLPTAADPSEPSPAEAGDPPPLPPRPSGLRSDPAGLATRFVAEWLTYPPGVEPPPALASRLGDLMSLAFRTSVERLSAAGMDDRPGSVAVMGATTPLEPAVFRVTVWQASDGPSRPLAGPYSWDVTVVADPRGGWLVDGLRRAG